MDMKINITDIIKDQFECDNLKVNAYDLEGIAEYLYSVGEEKIEFELTKMIEGGDLNDFKKEVYNEK